MEAQITEENERQNGKSKVGQSSTVTNHLIEKYDGYVLRLESKETPNALLL